ncbi:unnamed protein product, partial [Lampetra planeri]
QGHTTTVVRQGNSHRRQQGRAQTPRADRHPAGHGRPKTTHPASRRTPPPRRQEPGNHDHNDTPRRATPRRQGGGETMDRGHPSTVTQSPQAPRPQQPRSRPPPAQAQPTPGERGGAPRAPTPATERQGGARHDRPHAHPRDQ